MKKKGNRCDYVDSRNENLRRELLARLGTGGRTVKELMRMVGADIPAPRFYISEEQAYREICRGRRGGVGNPRGLLSRRRMIADIKVRARWLMAADPALSLKEAVFRAVNSPAPSYYLAFNSVRKIIYHRS